MVHPNKVTLNLWSWLSKHLEQKLLIEWVINKGGLLHPELLDQIKRQLKRETPPVEPYLSFWRIVTSDLLLCDDPEDIAQHNIINTLEKIDDELSYREFVQLLQPKLHLKRYYELPEEFIDIDGEGSLSRINKTLRLLM